jgi:RNase P subunit RPR2
VAQKSVACKSCKQKFLAPAVDTGRQEISSDIDESAAFALICPFCMAHARYTARDLE